MWPVIGFYYLNFLMGLDDDSITFDRTYAIIVFNDKFKQTIRLKRALSTLISENSVACDRILLFELLMGLDNDSITCDRTCAIIVFNDKFKQPIRLKRAFSTLISKNSVACDRILLFELFNGFG